MQKWIEYLTELRKRILHTLLLFIIVFVPCAYFSSDIYQKLALPLLKNLTGHTGIIAISVVSPFMIPLKCAFYLCAFIVMPYFLYQIGMFIMPALYRQERRAVYFFLISSSVLFYVGMIFAYFVVLPFVFQFFIAIAPAGVEVKPDIREYFGFTLRLLLAFGLSFEVPIVMLLLVRANLLTVTQLRNKRPYVIVAAFILGMLLTPPDVISQILLAIPLWWLFEFGLWLCSKISVDSPVISKME